MTAVLLDVDEVLADFSGWVMSHLKERGIEPINRDAYDMVGWYPVEHRAEVIKALQQVDPMQLSPCPGAEEGCARLAEKHRIVCVTKHMKGHSTWVHRRELWLEKHFPKIEYVIHTRNKSDIHGLVLVDDNPEHCTAWSVKQGKTAVLWHCEHNEKARPHNSVRIDSWEGLINYVDHEYRERQRGGYAIP